MGDWQDEEQIKAQLRLLTRQLKQLREELRDLVSPPPKTSPSRAFLHRKGWPGEGADDRDSVDDRDNTNAVKTRPSKKR